MNRRLALALVLGGLAVAPAPAQEKLDWATLGRIRDEGFRRSQVMETAAQLTDVHGPRLTGSPQYKKAADWARQQLETWGLANAHLESWPFGRGWSFERCSAHVVSPTAFPLVALPKAWTAGTDGPVRGKVMRAKVESEADVEALKGKIAGMIVWLGQPRELKAPEEGGVFKRYTEEQLDEIEQYRIPGPRGPRGQGRPPYARTSCAAAVWSRPSRSSTRPRSRSRSSSPRSGTRTCCGSAAADRARSATPRPSPSSWSPPRSGTAWRASSTARTRWRSRST